MNKESIKLISNFLGIETREDWRENNKGNMVKINFDSKQDQAYVRCQFKRFLLNCKNSNMVIRTNRLENYRSDISDYDFNNLQDRNKLIKSIENCCKHIITTGEVPEALKFEF